MRLAIAATTVLLCLGLLSCGDDGDSKPIAAASQACRCKLGEQGTPQLKPQVTDGGSTTTHAWHDRHSRSATGGHASWTDRGGRYMARRHYAMHEHRYAARAHHYGTDREGWRERSIRHPEHRWRHGQREGWAERFTGHPERRWGYTERDGWRYSHRGYAPQPFLYDYVSRSRRSSYDYGEREEYRGGSAPCCRCHADCDGRHERHGEYRASMSINDPAALDPWQGYGVDNCFTRW